jgi:hypothetical protein
MTKFREKAQARTMQIVGQMIGDDLLVQEGKEEERKAEEESKPPKDHPGPTSQGPSPAS